MNGEHSKRVIIGISFPADLWAAIVKKAATEGRSGANWLKMLAAGKLGVKP